MRINTKQFWDLNILKPKTIVLVFSGGNLWPEEQDQDHLAAKINMTSGNSFETLHTLLMLTQGISAAVVGTERRTHTTLNLDHLYNRGIRLQQSVGNSNWILWAGVLHIAFGALYAIGKTIDGSGIDICVIEWELIHDLQYFEESTVEKHTSEVLSTTSRLVWRSWWLGSICHFICPSTWTSPCSVFYFQEGPPRTQSRHG